MSKPFITLKGQDASQPIALGMSRHSGHVAVARENNRVELWNIKGDLLGSHVAHEQPVGKICVSDDGRLVATLGKPTSDDEPAEDLIVWDCEQSAINRISPSPSDGGFRAPIFLPRCHQLAVATDQPLIYDGATGKTAGFPLPRDLAWNAVDFGFWTTGMALGMEDGRVHWVSPHAPTKGSWLLGHTAMVTHLAFSSDGDTLGTLGRDGMLRFWLAGSSTEFSSAAVCCGKPLHFSYVYCNAWLVVDHEHGLRFFDEEGQQIASAELPNPSTVTSVTSDIWTKAVVIGRQSGVVEIWNTHELVPDLQAVAS